MLKIMIKILNLKLEFTKFKVASILKPKIFFAKCCADIWSEKVFVIKEIENSIPRAYVISDMNG